MALAIGASAQDVLRTPETQAAIQQRFTREDEALLDEIEHACFLYFWKEVGSPACLAKDRMKGPVASIAAVGFQLSSLPIGVERKWISRAEGEQRARTVLEALLKRDDNRKWGMYLHFPDMNDAGPDRAGFASEYSTVDTALLLVGAMPAAEYFGGEVAALVERMLREANWKAYVEAATGNIYMAWHNPPPDKREQPGGFSKYTWRLANDEERLVYWLAVGSPNPEHALEPVAYYRLKRELRPYKDIPPFVVSWPGIPFTYFFSHCWIDYRSFEADDPKRFGIDAPRVDWFESSRRALLAHRLRCIEMSDKYKTLSPERWGLSACAARDGYIVPEIFPNLSGHEQWFEGTVAPYAAASSIMFLPSESLAALRAFRNLKDAGGNDLIWRDPKKGGYGLVDSFNLDQNYACDDYTGIDVGPMLLAIENARSGLIWRLFMQHPGSKRAVERLKLERRAGR